LVAAPRILLWPGNAAWEVVHAEAVGRIIFSPSDINVFFESAFASWMDRFHLEYPDAVKPDAPPDDKKLVAQDGHRTRAAPPGSPEERRTRRVRSARAVGIRDHARSHARGTCPHLPGEAPAGDFEGYADFLHRVETPSALGAWSYEVADTKLARKPKPYFLLQLCGYAKMLEHIQGVRPENVHVVNAKASD